MEAVVVEVAMAAVDAAMKSEREVAPIIAKCQEAMEKAIEGVSSSKDCAIIIEK